MSPGWVPVLTNVQCHPQTVKVAAGLPRKPATRKLPTVTKCIHRLPPPPSSPTSPTYMRLSLTGLPPRRLAGLPHDSGAQEPCFNVGRRLLQQFKVTETTKNLLQHGGTQPDICQPRSGCGAPPELVVDSIRYIPKKKILGGGGGGISYYIRLPSTQSADWLKSSKRSVWLF